MQILTDLMLNFIQHTAVNAGISPFFKLYYFLATKISWPDKDKLNKLCFIKLLKGSRKGESPQGFLSIQSANLA